MHRTHCSVAMIVAAAVAFVAGCGGDRADNRASGGSGARATGDTRSEVPQHSRLVGCLQRGALAGTFVLTDTESPAVGTAGASSPSPPRTYPLVNTGDTDLTNYVGSRVIVSGRFQVDSDMPAVDRAPGPADRAESTADVKELIVEDVERTDGRCESVKP